MWVRGVKHLLGDSVGFGVAVAPYVGAWIETNLLKATCYL